LRSFKVQEKRVTVVSNGSVGEKTNYSNYERRVLLGSVEEELKHLRRKRSYGERRIFV